MDSDILPVEEKHQELEQHVVIGEGNENMKNLIDKCFETYL